MGILEVLAERPVLGVLFAQRVAVTEAQRRLAEEFKRGIAVALGVPPEAIRQEPIERWIKRWTAAFVRPEYWADVAVALSGSEAERLGMELARIVREALAAR